MSAELRSENRTFALAYQLSLVEFAGVIDRMVSGRGAAGRGHSPAAPHEPRQLCGGGDHDALRALPGERRILSLLDRPAVRRIWRQRRTGRASLHHIEPSGRSRRALLHAARRPRRQHLETLCRREFPVLAIWRHLSALEPPRGVPGRGTGRHPDHRDARRPALLHGRADDRAANQDRASQRPAGDRPRLRHPTMRTGFRARTSTTSPMRRSLRSGRPARSARASIAPIARPRRPGGCSRSIARESRFRPSPSWPARAPRVPARARDDPNAPDRRPRRRSIAGSPTVPWPAPATCARRRRAR